MTRLPLLALSLALTGCATMQGHEGTAADVASTAVALQIPGVVEANPLALIGLPIRIAIVEHAKTLPEHEGKPLLHASAAVGWGAFGNNVLIAALGKAAAVAGPVAGIAIGYFVWARGEREREYYRQCAVHRELAGRHLECKFSEEV